MKDDRGNLDLTKQIQELNSQNEGLKKPNQLSKTRDLGA